MSEERPSNRPGQEAPTGLTLRQTLTSGGSRLFRLAWSPIGDRIVAGAIDTAVRVWDARMGALVTLFPRHRTPVASVAWAPSGMMIASGDEEGGLLFWDPERGDVAQEVGPFRTPLECLAWSPDGRWLASASGSGRIRAHPLPGHGSYGTSILVAHHPAWAHAVAWSPDGRFLASCAEDDTVRITEFRPDASYAAPAKTVWLKAERGVVIDLAWHPRLPLVAVACSGRSVRLIDPIAGREVRALEGHTDVIKAVAFSVDGRLLASKAHDDRVLIWDCETWEVLAALDEPMNKDIAPNPGLAFHPTAPALASLGDLDRDIRVWDIDVDALRRGRAGGGRAVNYASAKIVLLGDSGVGKTGLGWRLAHGEFREHSSTHGEQFWRLDSLDKTRDDGARCEAVLWDFAGQPDYRLIHGLFLDDADLALVLFDPTNRADPFRGAEFWLKALAHRAGGACRTILVAARVDRGVPAVDDAEIDRYVAEKKARGYVATSAKSGQGIDELLALIAAEVPWDDLAATVTTPTFQRIKQEVLALKEDPGRSDVLAGYDDFRRRLGDQAVDEGEVSTAAHNLAKHGFVRVLKTNAGTERVLLVPELLNNVAASFVVEARREPRGLGVLDEALVLRGDYDFPDLARVRPEERSILLDATTTLFLRHNICFRQTVEDRTLLVFPELINRKRPRDDDTPMTDDVSYTATGAVENLYAMAVVLLGYAPSVRLAAAYQNQARFEVGDGEVCGLRQSGESEGELDLVLSYSREARPDTKALFQGLVERVLFNDKVSVRRYPPLVCPECGEPQERDVVVRRIRQGHGHVFCAECGARIPLPSSDLPARFPSADLAAVDRKQATAWARTRFEEALVRLKSTASERLQGRRPAPCALVWAPDEPGLAPVIRAIENDLRNAGLNVLPALGVREGFLDAGGPPAGWEPGTRAMIVASPRLARRFGLDAVPHVDAIRSSLHLFCMPWNAATNEQYILLFNLFNRLIDFVYLAYLFRGPSQFIINSGHYTYFILIIHLIASLFGIPYGDPALEESERLLLPSRPTDWGARRGAGEGYDLQLMSWGDGSQVPTSGQNLVVAGTDSNGLLHIRTFDLHGVRTDIYEAMKDGTLHLVSAGASGSVRSETPASSLPTARSQAIANIKQQLPGLLPPHDLSVAERNQVLSDATFIIGQTPGEG
jgi:small GTP-binding protein